MILKSEHAVNIIDKLGNAYNFILDLFRQHKDMRIILCKGTYSHQSMKRAGQFVPMHLT